MTQLLDRFEKKEKLRQVARRVYYKFEVAANILLKDIGLYAFVVCCSDQRIDATKDITLSPSMYMNIEFIELFAEISDAITHQTTTHSQEQQQL